MHAGFLGSRPRRAADETRASCAAIAAPEARLACYDALAHRPADAEGVPLPAASQRHRRPGSRRRRLSRRCRLPYRHRLPCRHRRSDRRIQELRFVAGAAAHSIRRPDIDQGTHSPMSSGSGRPRHSSCSTVVKPGPRWKTTPAPKRRCDHHQAGGNRGIPVESPLKSFLSRAAIALSSHGNLLSVLGVTQALDPGLQCRQHRF